MTGRVAAVRSDIYLTIHYNIAILCGELHSNKHNFTIVHIYDKISGYKNTKKRREEKRREEKRKKRSAQRFESTCV